MDELENTLTRGDIVTMALFVVWLTERGISLDTILTNEEKHRYRQVLKNNEMSQLNEDSIMLELVHNLFVKSGVRTSAVAQYIN